MKFNDLKTGEKFDVDIKDIELKEINKTYYAVAKSPTGHEVMKKIGLREYLAIKSKGD